MLLGKTLRKTTFGKNLLLEIGRPWRGVLLVHSALVSMAVSSNGVVLGLVHPVDFVVLKFPLFLGILPLRSLVVIPRWRCFWFGLSPGRRYFIVFFHPSG